MKLTKTQADKKLRQMAADRAPLGPRMARLSLCDRSTGEAVVVDFACPDMYPELFEGVDWDAVEAEITKLESERAVNDVR